MLSHFTPRRLGLRAKCLLIPDQMLKRMTEPGSQLGLYRYGAHAFSWYPDPSRWVEMTLETWSSQWYGDRRQMQCVNAASLLLVQNHCSVSHSLKKHFRKLHLSTRPFSHWVNKHGDTSQVALIVKQNKTKKNPPKRSERCGFHLWVGKIPWRRAWQPTPVFLPGECHGQRSLAGYRPLSHKESDITEKT